MEMEKEKSCDDCVNRLLCPTRKKDMPYSVCDGYNDEGVFAGLLYLNFQIDKDRAKRMLSFVKEMQGK